MHTPVSPDLGEGMAPCAEQKQTYLPRKGRWSRDVSADLQAIPGPQVGASRG